MILFAKRPKPVPLPIHGAPLKVETPLHGVHIAGNFPPWGQRGVAASSVKILDNQGVREVQPAARTRIRTCLSWVRAVAARSVPVFGAAGAVAQHGFSMRVFPPLRILQSNRARFKNCLSNRISKCNFGSAAIGVFAKRGGRIRIAVEQENWQGFPRGSCAFGLRQNGPAEMRAWSRV